MSRTYKIHTHKAGRDTRITAQNKSKRHSFRNDIKSALIKINDYDDLELPKEKEFGCKKRSSGYGLVPFESEQEFINNIIEYERYNINSYSILSDFQKILLNEIIIRNDNFKKLPKPLEMKYEERKYYIELAFKTFTEDELKQFAHKLFMVKDGKPNKQE